MAEIVCLIEFPNGKQYSFNDVLLNCAHYRGFAHSASYCLLDIFHTSVDVIPEFGIYSDFTLQYGRDKDLTPKFPMTVFSTVGGADSPTRVNGRIVGIEPGWTKLHDKQHIRSYPNTSISDIVATLSQESQIETSGIVDTNGKFTFIQPNVTNIRFITDWLLPIATDAAGSVPYLFTIDHGTVYLKAPDLTAEAQRYYLLDPTKDNSMKSFEIKNTGISKDIAFGDALTVYGYNFREKGTLVYNTDTNATIITPLNKKPYDSGFSRIEFPDYQEEWMLRAYARNKLAKANFILTVDAIVEGEFLDFDRVIQIEIPRYVYPGKAEFSGLYYVYEVVSHLSPHSFNQYLTLKSNSFLRNRVYEG